MQHAAMGTKNMIRRTARIYETNANQPIYLHLILDKDMHYRWYQATDDGDTEVSGRSVREAIAAARAAWRAWHFSILRASGKGLGPRGY